MPILEAHLAGGLGTTATLSRTVVVASTPLAVALLTTATTIVVGA
jgi:hypothetical protein